MNSLSFLIYKISVLISLKYLLTAIIVVSILLIGISAFATLISFATGSYTTREQLEGFKPFRSNIAYYIKRVIAVFSIALIVNIFVPEQKYLILIAASEVGEAVVKSEAVQSAGGEIAGLSKDSVTLLRMYIQQQISEFEKESKNDLRTN